MTDAQVYAQLGFMARCDLLQDIDEQCPAEQPPTGDVLDPCAHEEASARSDPRGGLLTHPN